MGSIHFADIGRSERLQELRDLLFRGPRTTLEILEQTKHTRAVSAAITELRRNGIPVDCECIGKGRFRYSIPEGFQPELNLKTKEA